MNVTQPHKYGVLTEYLRCCLDAFDTAARRMNDRDNSELKWWNCKYCGENKSPQCHKCVRDDGKSVSDELTNSLDV